MSVFDGPLPQQQAASTNIYDTQSNQPPSNEYLDDPLHHSDSDEEIRAHVLQRNNSNTNNNDLDSEEHDTQNNSDNTIDDLNDMDDDDDVGVGLDPTSPSKNYFSQNAGKINTRYLNYRSSLTNSVRGSLLECSVPENDEESFGGGDDDHMSTVSARQRSHSQQQQRLKKYMSAQRSTNPTAGGGRKAFMPPANSTASNPNNLRSVRHHGIGGRFGGAAAGNGAVGGANGVAVSTAGQHVDGAGYAGPSIYHIRRFMSTIDAASFFNAPVNLESVEFNLRNSLVKKCSDTYRKNHRHHSAINHHGTRTHHKSPKCSTLFLDYLTYLTSYRLLLNGMLLVLALSFFLNMCGLCVVVFYIRELSMSKQLEPHHATQVLSLIGFMGGLGRLVSTLSYKVNESNAKSRIFAYTLTVLLTGASVFVCTVLCDTVFSFAMFAITFGLLFGNFFYFIFQFSVLQKLASHQLVKTKFYVKKLSIGSESTHFWSNKEFRNFFLNIIFCQNFLNVVKNSPFLRYLSKLLKGFYYGC
jgi:hypothetical protein